jgi:hypothetical protein
MRHDGILSGLIDEKWERPTDVSEGYSQVNPRPERQGMGRMIFEVYMVNIVESQTRRPRLPGVEPDSIRNILLVAPVILSRWQSVNH